MLDEMVVLKGSDYGQILFFLGEYCKISELFDGNKKLASIILAMSAQGICATLPRRLTVIPL